MVVYLSLAVPQSVQSIQLSNPSILSVHHSARVHVRVCVQFVEGRERARTELIKHCSLMLMLVIRVG